MIDGFIKIAAAIPHVFVADVAANTRAVESMMVAADGKGAEIICFPELGITAYTCQDLFAQQLLLEEAEHALVRLLELSRNLHITLIIGLPFAHKDMLFNCAAVIQGGKLHGLVPKTFIPNYKEFYEKRWFSPSTVLPQGEVVRFCGQNVPLGACQLFRLNDVTFGIEICEDLWAPIPPSDRLALEGAEIIFNLSASNDLTGKNDYVRDLVRGQSARCHCAYVYAGCGFGESTQDIVFGGRAFIAENGHLLCEAEPLSLTPQTLYAEIDLDRLRSERRANTSFAQSIAIYCGEKAYPIVELETTEWERQPFTLTRYIDPLPFVPRGEELDKRSKEILGIQSVGLAQRLAHTQARNIVIGISGGLDSTLALLVCVNAFDLLQLDRKGIIGITMPGFGTSDRTHDNALRLMDQLGVTRREIPIADAVQQHFKDIDHNPETQDITYENAQARERTQILMDIANQSGGFVIGTGDLSELALGWATYNGDHMSMYAVNASVPKTLIRHLVQHIAEELPNETERALLTDIVNTPISPELLPGERSTSIAQKTEDIVGPYELNDFFLYYTLRFGFRPTKIFRLALHAFKNSDDVPTFDEATVARRLHVFFRRFFTQQFKRSCLPDSPKVGSCSLSPRGDWRMPSDAFAAEWLRECETLLVSDSNND